MSYEWTASDFEMVPLLFIFLLLEKIFRTGKWAVVRTSTGDGGQTLTFLVALVGVSRRACKLWKDPCTENLLFLWTRDGGYLPCWLSQLYDLMKIFVLSTPLENVTMYTYGKTNNDLCLRTSHTTTHVLLHIQLYTVHIKTCTHAQLYIQHYAHIKSSLQTIEAIQFQSIPGKHGHVKQRPCDTWQDN